MTVGTTLRAWSATAANNSPKGTDVIGTSADDELRQIQATVRQYLASQSGTVVPSAGVADLTTATGHWVPVSGSSTITGLGSEDAGIEYVLNFTGAPILVHSTALQLPGDATVQAGTADVCVAESLGSGNWKIWGYSRIASQADQEAATNTVATVTPARQQYHPSAAKAWVNCGAAGDINASYNVSSVTDTGTGLATVNFTVAFSSANYCSVVGLQSGSAVIPRINNSTPPTASACVINSVNTANAATDPVAYNAVFFGDQ